MKLQLDPTTLRLQRVLRAHFDPRDGSPYWLDRQRELGLDVPRAVRGVEDLALLGPFDRRHLVDRPLEDFVPRTLWRDRAQLVLAETGGTTGRPIRSVFTRGEFEEAFGAPMAAVSSSRHFPRGAGWLFVGPSGPHVIGQAARLLARLHDSLEPFSVDLDPRWARRTAPDSLGARLYGQHVIDQALDVLARERVGVLFTTPPVALELAEALTPEQRAEIRGIHLGGMALSREAYARIRAAFDAAVVVPGYGNSMFGLMIEATEPAGPAPDADYFPLSGRLVARVVAEREGVAELDREVAVGAVGRVVLSRLDESFFLPNLVERDRATSIAASPEITAMGLAPRGLRNPCPVVEEQAERGLY